jgi:hypothetical protein
VIEAPLARENGGERERERESVMCARSLFVLFVLFLVKKKTDARARKIFKTLGGCVGAHKCTKVSKDKGVSLCITI